MKSEDGVHECALELHGHWRKLKEAFIVRRAPGKIVKRNLSPIFVIGGRPR